MHLSTYEPRAGVPGARQERVRARTAHPPRVVLGAPRLRVVPRPAGRDDDECAQRGQVERVEHPRERARVAKLEHVPVEAEFERAERCGVDPGGLGGRGAEAEGGTREGEGEREVREVRKVVEEAGEVEGEIAVEGEVRYLRVEGAWEEVDRCPVAFERDVSEMRGSDGGGRGGFCGVVDALDRVQRDEDGSQRWQARLAHEMVQVRLIDVQTQLFHVRAVRDRDLKEVRAQCVSMLPKVSARQARDAHADGTRAGPVQPPRHHLHLELIVPHATVVQRNRRPQLGRPVRDGSPPTAHVREDQRGGTRTRHNVRGVREAVLKDLLEDLVRNGAQWAEPCAMDSDALLHGTALALQEMHLGVCARDARPTGVHVVVDALEGGAVERERVLSRDILGCVGWGHGVDHVGLHLDR